MSDRDEIRRKINDELSGKGPKPSKPRRGGGPRTRPGQRPEMRIQTTTLWEYPSQHYDGAKREQGSKDYVGASPSWVIWQLLQRYTREKDVVLDPMCGSGTTLDVCADLDREGIGFDLNPQRKDITKADAREIPLDNESVDFVFIDPPYSTHIDYSDDDRCIGKLDASTPPEHPGQVMGHAYYTAMDRVIDEIHRVLRPNRYMALYVSDSFKKTKGVKGGVFMPIGFELFGIMAHSFKPVDIVCVVRHNTKLQRGNWHKAAQEQNFFLRGFNYLFIMKKTDD